MGEAHSEKPTAKPASRWQAIAGSYVCVAFLALLAADGIARVCWNLDPYIMPNRSWVWWNTRDFRQNAQNTDVMLMGSSLMMAALHGADATYQNVAQNVALHHRCVYLEKLMGDKLNSPVRTFAFALGGQMVSDADVLAETLFKGDKKPHTIVYGVAPRDFMDNMMPSPASTETFRYMERLGDLRSIALSSRYSFWEQTEWWIGQTSFLYRQRPDFVYLQNKYSRQILAAVCGVKGLDFLQAPRPLRRLAMLEIPEDKALNDLTVAPHDQTPKYFFDNLPEYRMRYRLFKPKVFNTQLSFLERLLKFGEREGINVVIVNMPLTQDNVDLMPAGFYSRYKQSIQLLAQQHRASFLDLHDTSAFPKSYFTDSVHMNGLGGMHFFEVLSERLAHDSELAARARNITKKQTPGFATGSL